ncbi:hypothetical protein FNZ07_19350 [Paraburkholderia megapolitana]|nr:hypothetical protein FNZ07_19350 [Paraburkholderia megapolitana]
MSVYAGVLQYRPFRRVFPPAGVGRSFCPQYSYLSARLAQQSRPGPGGAYGACRVLFAHRAPPSSLPSAVFRPQPHATRRAHF